MFESISGLQWAKYINSLMWALTWGYEQRMTIICNFDQLLNYFALLVNKSSWPYACQTLKLTKFCTILFVAVDHCIVKHSQNGNHYSFKHVITTVSEALLNLPWSKPKPVELDAYFVWSFSIYLQNDSGLSIGRCNWKHGFWVASARKRGFIQGRVRLESLLETFPITGLWKETKTAWDGTVQVLNILSVKKNISDYLYSISLGMVCV